ncbi:Uncharacterised protein [Mycobacteroides abscessus subsp. abscessus]|nr:Uncharacterised protein [Mycobacteroides abscessus subsp. abscessus]
MISALRTVSAVKITSAAQIKTKPTQRSGGIASCLTSTPQSICNVGVTYCSSPRVTNGIRCAAAPNNNRGRAVTTPLTTISAVCPWV